MLVHYDVSAHLSLFHLLDFLVELKSLLLVAEPLLLAWSGGITSEARSVILAVVVMVMVVMMGIVVVGSG